VGRQKFRGTPTPNKRETLRVSLYTARPTFSEDQTLGQMQNNGSGAAKIKIDQGILEIQPIYEYIILD